ncbi:MAG: hypothetical protein AB1774_10985 [Bacillota bacterium]
MRVVPDVVTMIVAVFVIMIVLVIVRMTTAHLQFVFCLIKDAMMPFVH